MWSLWSVFLLILVTGLSVAAACHVSTLLVVPYLFTISASQLLLELVVKTTPRGQVRVGANSGFEQHWLRFVVACKRLQGFHPDHHFEFVAIGEHWSAYTLVFFSWFSTLSVHTDLRGLPFVGVLLGLTVLCYLVPMYTIALAYTGQAGEIHGFGFNIYASFELSGTLFHGERFIALDWHPEKLQEQVKGKVVPRSAMRTVTWPHLHLCFWKLEFWPWERQPSNLVAMAMEEAQKHRKERHAAQQLQKKQEEVAEGMSKEKLDHLLDDAVTKAVIKTQVEHNVPVVALVQEVVTQVMQECGMADDEQLLKIVRGMAGKLVGRAVGAMKKKVKQ